MYDLILDADLQTKIKHHFGPKFMLALKDRTCVLVAVHENKTVTDYSLTRKARQIIEEHMEFSA